MRVLRNGQVYRYDSRRREYFRHSGLILDGARIASCDPNDAGAGVESFDLGGATVLPAFADCHVHLTDTGYFLGEHDLSSVRSYDEYSAAVTRMKREPIMLAGQYDESSWTGNASADAQPLERSFPETLAMLVRIDGHSCIVNRKTFGWLALPQDLDGIELDAGGEPTGKLFLDANWHAQFTFMEAIPLQTRRDAERTATERALSQGCLHLHAQLVGFAHDRYAQEIAALDDLPPAKWYPKVCEPDPDLARQLGLPYVGGDVFLDGSIGSCTAAVSQPFLTPLHAGPPNGKLNYSDEEIHQYFSRAESLGVSAGVHAIGDRAIEQCVATWERVLDGSASTRGTRHFIEHFEIATQDQIDRCARLGIYLSMQPQFDLLWGGTGRMYAQRLGEDRMRSMNALGRIQRSGAVLCGGDDSPVCKLSPLDGMQAAVDHHERSERLTPEQALTMYTYNAARLAHVEDLTGILAPGYAADLVVLDRDPLDGARFSGCAVLSTWRDGEVVYGGA